MARFADERSWHRGTPSGTLDRRTSVVTCCHTSSPPLTTARSRVRRVASYTKGHRTQRRYRRLVRASEAQKSKPWGVGSGPSRRGTECAARTVTYHSPLPTPLCHRGPGRETAYGAEGARTPDLLGAIQALSQLSYSPVGCGT